MRNPGPELHLASLHKQSKALRNLHTDRDALNPDMFRRLQHPAQHFLLGLVSIASLLILVMLSLLMSQCPITDISENRNLPSMLHCKPEESLLILKI